MGWLVGAVPFARTVSNSVMFVAQMAFFNRVSDPKIGGTYMTMLSTISNLGSQWPGPAASRRRRRSRRTRRSTLSSSPSATSPSPSRGSPLQLRAAALQSMAIKQWHA